MPYAQTVDVRALAGREAARHALITELCYRVGICRVDVLVFFDREGGVIEVSQGERDPVDSGAAGEDYLPDPQFAGRIDDVVCTLRVGPERFVVWHYHVTFVACEVDNGVWPGWSTFWERLSQGPLSVERIEDLSTVGEVGLEGMYGWMRQWYQV